jgi:hypothetical protein
MLGIYWLYKVWWYLMDFNLVPNNLLYQTFKGNQKQCMKHKTRVESRVQVGYDFKDNFNISCFFNIFIGQYPHCGAFEWDYLHRWWSLGPISPSCLWGSNVKVQILESIRDLSRHRGIFYGYTLVIDGLHILDVPGVFRTLLCIF